MSRSAPTVRQGVIVGLIGYFSVAAFYAAFDLIAARGPLYTVNLLGMSVFKGLRDPGVLGVPIHPDTSAIFWYNAFHLAVSIVIGLIVTGLVELAERRPPQARMALFTIIGGFFVTIIVVGLLTSSIRPLLPWWSIVIANAFAVLLAGRYLMWKRPGTWSRLSPFAH